jgi:methionyl-tRNA formyltransferase
MKTICIAGKNEIAVNALKYLKDNYPNFNYSVILNKTEDGITGWQPSLSFTAKKLKVKEVSLAEVYDIEDLIFLSLEFDLLIKPSLFKSKSLFNIHFSALPKFKGMYTSVLPILYAETSSGVTLHKIDIGIDTGDIIDQIIFPINDNTTCKDLYQHYLDNSLVLLKKNVKSLIENNYSSSKQNSQQSSYFSKKSIDFSDIKIDLNKTAFEIHNQFRAFTFREYQLPKYNDWNIFKTKITQTKNEFKPGNLLHEDDSHFLLSTIDYNIILFKDYYDILWESCRDGSYETVASVIKHIPDINLRNKKGWNALILSVYNNHPKISELLINYSPNNSGDIDSSNYKGTTVIMYALSCYKNTGDDTTLKLILSNSPDLHRKDETGRNIFDYAENDDNILNLLNME